MQESILIRNFGPIKEVEIEDIRPFTIFIGESGSGKSTIMKLLALFRWIYKMVNIRSYLREAGISKSPFRFSLSTYMTNAGFENYLKDDSEIVYQKGSCILLLKNKSLNTNTSVRLDELSLEKICFISDKRNMIPDILANHTEKRTANFFLKETFEDFREAIQKLKSLTIDYLNIRIAMEKSGNMDKYRIRGVGEEDFAINWEDASSGMQTVTPLSVIVDYFSGKYDIKAALNRSVFKYLSDSDDLKNFRPIQNVGDIKNRCVNIHIEEPELSLFPESQKNLMDFLVTHCLTGEKDYQIKLMLATHSPYIVNYLNLLIKRHEKGNIQMPNIAFGDVDVFEIGEGYCHSLKLPKEHSIIDTRIMSDPISSTYAEYNRLK